MNTRISKCRAFAWALMAIMTSMVNAVSLDTTNYDSIRNATKLIATDMMGYYSGNLPGQTPGYLPGNGQPGGYFWWVGGGMFGTMINYWYHTGDTTWNNMTIQAISFQSDPSSGGYFDSANVSLQLGNDDQAFWAFSAMEAAEYDFPAPPSPYPSWLAMAQGVFNQQAQRWDAATCGGGLRWQAVFTNAGYNYKNSISNGAFFQLAARLGKYTGNHTYTDWAIKTWDWSVSAGLINITNNYEIIDGIYIDTCTPDGGTGSSEAQWTYNVGVYLYGAAALWNITQNDPSYANQSDIWKSRTQGLVQGTNVFFPENTNSQRVLSEVICEPYGSTGTCTVDQTSFKGYLARWMRETTYVAPFTLANVTYLLKDSASLAALSCSAPGLNGGAMCGQQWYLVPEQYDNRSGIGMQINALEVIQTLIPSPGPNYYLPGAVVVGSDPSAGSNPTASSPAELSSNIIDVTTGDKAGAWILFVLFAGATIAGAWWIITDPGPPPKLEKASIRGVPVMVQVDKEKMAAVRRMESPGSSSTSTEEV